jgi:hypothetical protein
MASGISSGCVFETQQSAGNYRSYFESDMSLLPMAASWNCAHVGNVADVAELELM